MKKTMHCMRCGSAIELDYTSKWQKYQCAGCGIEFKIAIKRTAHGNSTITEPILKI